MSHILIVEPDVRLAAVYAQTLRNRQHTVSVAVTAQDAICQADTTCPDLVILELQLTAHSGIEFLYEFRSYVDWQLVPVVVLSQLPPAEFAHSQQLLRQRLGVQDYRYKPRTSLRALLQAVESALVRSVAA